MSREMPEAPDICMDTECGAPDITVRVRVELPGREAIFSFCSEFCARESLDDVVGRFLAKEGRVVMRA